MEALVACLAQDAPASHFPSVILSCSVKSDVDSYTRPSPHYKQSGLLVYLQRGCPQSSPTVEIQYNAQDEFLQSSTVGASLGSLEEYRLSVKEASKITFKNHLMEDFWRNHTPQGRHHHLAEVVESMLYGKQMSLPAFTAKFYSGLRHFPQIYSSIRDCIRPFGNKRGRVEKRVGGGSIEQHRFCPCSTCLET